MAGAPEPAVAPWPKEKIRHINSAKNIATKDQSHDEMLQQKPRGINTLLKVAQEPEKPSALEEMYAARVADQVQQFGYDLFGVPNSDIETRLDGAGGSVMPMGEVQDDFVLSSGDELEIVFTGQRSERSTYKVNSRGMLLLPDFPPIPAEGRTIGQVRISVSAAAANLYNTETYVSLASVRQIGVLVIGNVKKPGRQTLTVFHTVLDALMEAGGIQKTGSLRQIKLVRNGRSMMVDLYALLMHGSTNIDLRLHDGDRIIIPAIGPTVAIAGEVKRPGIYEILPSLNGMLHQPDKNSQKLSLDEMLQLGGGTMAPGQNRFMALEVTPAGQEKVTEVHEAFDLVFGDGAILMVSKGQEKRQGMVELVGATRRPGLHALDESPTLSKLIASEDILGPDAYPLIGVIERTDADQLTRQLVDFPLRLVLKGDYDRKLDNGDVVHLFSMKQIRKLADEKIPDEEEPVEMGSQQDDEDPSTIEDEAIAGFLKERSVFVRGAVRDPGPYPVSEGATLDSVLATAGGLTLEASTGNIEVTSALQGEGLQSDGRSGTRRTKVDFRETNPTAVRIAAGDAVRVGQRFQKVEDKSVLIIGEVHNPGRYDLLPDDKVSDLINRAGGLTEQAYVEGAIFSRDSERRAEESRFRSQAQGIKRAISAALSEDDEKVDTGKIEEARALATELEQAPGVGRITVEADPGSAEHDTRTRHAAGGR